jgi:hypothetical protein
MIRLIPLICIAIFTFLFTQDGFASIDCPEGKHWVDPHFRKSYYRFDGVHVDAADVSGHCRLNPKGYQLWHQRISSQRPIVWGYKNEVTKSWSVAEVEQFYEAISALPTSLINLNNIKVYRMSQSVAKENPATTNNRDIVLYDEAFQHKGSLTRIIAHELSHILFKDLSESEKEQFGEKSNWIVLKIKNETTYIAKSEKTYLQEDSANSIEEDFSNHMEEYLFDKNKVKAVSPKTTEWIQKKYGEDFKIQKMEKE